MNSFVRHLTMGAVLLSQLLLAVQSFATSACHTAGSARHMIVDEAPMTPHHGASGHEHALAVAGDDAPAVPEACDMSCQCAAGMHCSQLAAALPVSQAVPDLPDAHLPGLGRSVRSTSLPFAESPFRPPIRF